MKLKKPKKKKLEEEKQPVLTEYKDEEEHLSDEELLNL